MIAISLASFSNLTIYPMNTLHTYQHTTERTIASDTNVSREVYLITNGMTSPNTYLTTEHRPHISFCGLTFIVFLQHLDELSI